MPLAPNTRLGPYEIFELLGAGGMGEVYKARDTRLGRIVAIKVLPPDKVADAERKQRFLQEAKAASALNHPHIMAIYDIASEAGVDFIVMEYVPGKPLSSLIPRAGLPLGEALKYAAQMADALASAHAAGIVHRDLKPGNLIVTDSGNVKLLDFGLAKLVSPVSSDSEATRTLRTQEGAVMGTAAYMSPEQAEGRPVDSRSDTFSFGVMLYEMITGQRPFRGDTSISILSGILRDDPAPPRQLVSDLPAEVERVILRCLRKDPGRRFQHMEDLKVALEELREDTISGILRGVQAPAPRAKSRPWRWMAVAAAVLAAAAGALWFGTSRKSTSAPPLSAVPLTSYAGHVMDPAFSPDGNQVVFAWDGEQQDNIDIYLKLVGPGAPLRLTTHKGIDRYPAWSPDGRSIAFVRLVQGEQAVMLIPALGGPERKLVDGFAINLAWSKDGQWLLMSRFQAQRQVRAVFAYHMATGELRQLTTSLQGAWAGDQDPALSPDGRTLAFARSMTRASSQIYLLPVTASMTPSGEPRQLTSGNRAALVPVWTPDGREVIFSSTFTAGVRGALWRISAKAPPNTPATRVPETDDGESPVISSQGRLAFTRAIRDQNIWRLPLENGRAGKPERLVFSTRQDFEPRYAPDGRKIAFTSDRSGANEVWICDANGSNPLQLTSMNATMTSGARWSPDGQRLVFLSSLEGQQEIYLIGVNGGKPLRLTNNPAHDSAPSWSRDGKWIYFASNRSGRFEVWKMPPDPNGAPVQVTHDGGFSAIESVDGKVLYYGKARGGGIHAIMKMPLDGAPTDLGILANTWGDFDVTDRGIYYVSPPPKAEVRFLNFAGGPPVPIAPLEKQPTFGLAAAPDNRTVLYSQVDAEASELVLIENFH